MRGAFTMTGSFLRILALALLALAVWPGGVGSRDRVLVVALDGLDSVVLEELARQGQLPALAAHFRDGLQVSLEGWRGANQAGFWGSLFAGREPTGVLAGTTQGPTTRPVLWNEVTAAGGTAVAIGVPGTVSEEADRLFIAGAAPGEEFIGGGAGIVVDGPRVTGGEVDWPYSLAIDEVQDAVRSLERGGWSGWVRVATGERSGAFRVYRLGAARYYLSPVYALPHQQDGGLASESPLVFHLPFWATPGEPPGFLFELAVELSEAPFELALDKARGNWDLLVYFDPLAGLLARAMADFESSRVLAEARQEEIDRTRQVARAAWRTLDDRVRRLTAAAGPRACIAVVIDAEADRSRPSPTGASFAIRCGRELRGTATAHIQDVAPTLAYLLETSMPEASGGVVHAVAQRYGRVPVAARPAGESDPTGKKTVTFSGEGMRSIGAVTASTGEP